MNIRGKLERYWPLVRPGSGVESEQANREGHAETREENAPGLFRVITEYNSIR
ncbi:MAG: hypothetical protein IBX67_05570 [Dehalococcoidia bacterium]|nr:hypothetical protein [Dehalococcoidia bacterium]